MGVPCFSPNTRFGCNSTKEQRTWSAARDHALYCTMLDKKNHSSDNARYCCTNAHRRETIHETPRCLATHALYCTTSIKKAVIWPQISPVCWKRWQAGQQRQSALYCTMLAKKNADASTWACHASRPTPALGAILLRNRERGPQRETMHYTALCWTKKIAPSKMFAHGTELSQGKTRCSSPN